MRTVLYHDNCADGYGAAWACWERWRYDRTQYEAVKYGEEPPWHRIDDHDVLIVDFCYPRDTLLEVNRRAASLQVYDHHATAMNDCGDLEFCLFDLNRSGAGLTWDMIHPGKKRPWLIDYVEDRDLWRWNLPASRAVSYGLQMQPLGFPTWSRLAWDSHTEGQVREAGIAIQRYINRQLDFLRSQVYETSSFEHLTVPTINSPLLASELGEAMLEWYPHAPFAVIFSHRSDGPVKCDFRSRKGQYHVGNLAKRLVERGEAQSGGGHQASAGCLLTYPPI